MLDQERGVPYVSEQCFRRRLGASEIAVEVKISREFLVRGGILGDTVGYGKTACMIALVRETLGQTFTELTDLPDCERVCLDRIVFIYPVVALACHPSPFPSPSTSLPPFALRSQFSPALLSKSARGV